MKYTKKLKRILQLQKRKIFSSKGIPQHPSTYRLPPLHKIPVSEIWKSARLVCFWSLLFINYWQHGFPHIENKNAELQGSQRSGVVAGHALSTVGNIKDPEQKMSCAKALRWKVCYILSICICSYIYFMYSYFQILTKCII